MAGIVGGGVEVEKPNWGCWTETFFWTGKGSFCDVAGVGVVSPRGPLNPGTA